MLVRAQVTRRLLALAAMERLESRGQARWIAAWQVGDSPAVAAPVVEAPVGFLLRARWRLPLEAEEEAELSLCPAVELFARSVADEPSHSSPECRGR